MNERADRVLLVTSAPPGNAGVGEIILRDLCALLPADSVRICWLQQGEPRASGRCDDMCILRAPSDRRERRFPGRLGALAHAADVRFWLGAAAGRLARQVADEAEACRAGRVWAVLDSLVMVAVAGQLSRRLSVPLLTQVWDPPDHYARQCLWDRISRAWLAAQFGRAMRGSERVAVVSDSMGDEYHRHFGADCVIVRHTLDRSLGPQSLNPDCVRVGFAGSLHDPGQLDLLCEMLHRCGWQMAGKPVSLRLIGNSFRFRALGRPSRVELLGWRSTAETQALLGECDVLYLPIPFAADWTNFSRLSFPTKLSTYVAAGRPILVHAPSDSAVGQFCNRYGCGSVCAAMDVDALEKSWLAMLDPAAHAHQSEAIRTVYEQELCPAVMRRQFGRFLGEGITG